MEKLRIDLTKSRPRHSNDNGLAETKNGAVVPKCFGYSHIPQRFAAQINLFCAQHLNPYLNFHRPCLFAEDTVDAATRLTDNQAAQHFNEARRRLFQSIHRRSERAA
ncbi:MAG: hypothetical protein ACREU9_01775 [Gammaproteobacteria bacterium]